MFNLFRNEWRKLWAKKSSWILLLIAVAIAGLTAWGMRATGLQIYNTSAANAKGAARVFTTIWASGMAFVSIFAIVMTAIIITEEFAKNTIKLLLTRPYSRHAILFSKFLVSVAYLIVSLFVIYAVALGFTAAFYGVGVLNETITNHMNAWIYGLAAIGVQTLDNAFYLAVVFVMAAGMRSQGLAITFSILLQMLLSIATGLLNGLMVLKQWWWIRWNPFNLMSYDPLSTTAIKPAAAAINNWGWGIGLLVYIVVFYFIADYIFNRRDVSLS